MDSVVKLINEKYKDWIFGGIECVESVKKHNLNDNCHEHFLMLSFVNGKTIEKILLSNGHENIHIYPFEQTKTMLIDTKYTSACDNEDSESLNDFCLQYLNESESGSESECSNKTSSSTYNDSSDENDESD